MIKHLDWKRTEDYAFTETLGDQGWAWQFLRRNKDYQKDWTAELKIYMARVEQEGWSDKLISIDSPYFEVNPYKPDYEFKWGMYLLRNPQTDRPITLDIGVPPSRGIYSGRGGKMLSGDEIISRIIIPEGCAAVVFDLSKPIKQQLKNASQILLTRQKVLEQEEGLKITRQKNHKSNWVNYLRVFDAKTIGASNREISRIIFPYERNQYPEYNADDKVKKTYRQAQKLVNGDYLNILT